VPVEKSLLKTLPENRECDGAEVRYAGRLFQILVAETEKTHLLTVVRL